MGLAGAAAAAGVAVSAGTAIAGAANSGSAATTAAGQQTAAANQQAQLAQQIYLQNNQNLAPWRTTGTSGLYSLANLFGLNTDGTGDSGAGVGTSSPAGGALSQLMGLSGLNSNGQATPGAMPAALAQFAASPTYQFAQQQGQQALDRSAASKGLLLSGAQLKDSQSFGQGLASQQLGTYTTNLQNLYSGLVSGISNISNAGQNSAATVGQQGLASAGQIGQALGNAGTAQAAGTIGAANATNTGLSNSLAALTSSNSSYGNSPLSQLITSAGNYFNTPATTEAAAPTSDSLSSLQSSDFNLGVSK